MDKGEKYITQHLKDHREQVDMDGLWEGVAPHIPKAKRKRRIGYWMLGGVMLGIMISGVVIMTGLADSSAFSPTKLADFQKEDSVSKSISKKVGNLKEESDENGKNLHTITPQKSNEKDQYKKGKRENFKFTSIESETKKNTFFNATSEDKKIKPNNKAKVTNSSPNVSPNIVLAPTIHKSDNKNSNHENLNYDKTPIQERSELDELPLLAAKYSILNFESKSTEFNDVQVKVESKTAPSLNRWSVYLLGGGAVVNRTLHSRSIELVDERNRRASIANVLGAWQVEGGLGFRWSPKLTLLTGLNYTQVHEKAQFETEYQVDYEDVINTSIHRQDGSVENNSTTVTEQGIRSTDEIRYNQFRMLQIPIRMTYEIFQLEKIKLRIGAMTSFGIQQSYVGFTSFSGFQPSYDLSFDQDKKFKTRGTLTYGLFLEGATHLSRMTDFTFGLGVNRTSTMNTEIYLIDQQYTILSISTGLSRRF
ncbi:MAG: hypothetical protein AAGA77_23255 [Bacteroidota bacterium]